MATRRNNDGGSGIGILIGGILLFLGSCTGLGEDDGGAADHPNRSASMPDLIGMSLERAEERFDNWDYKKGPDAWNVEGVDYSARRRWVDDSWRVVTTRPLPGEIVKENTVVRFFGLRRSEIRWFKHHPRMPRLDRGVAPGRALGRKSPFRGVRGLIALRYPKVTKSRYERPRDLPLREGNPRIDDDPRIEPAREKFPRMIRRQAYPYDTQTVRAIPRPGQTLRLGQVLTVLVRDKPEKPIGYGAGNSYDPDIYLDDDDDDFNVPGWACPTRFC